MNEISQAESMLKMNRTMAKILGIIEFIGAAVSLICGIVLLAGMDEAKEIMGDTDGTAVIARAIAFFVIAALGIIMGVFLFRCAKDGSFAIALVVLAVICLIINVADNLAEGSDWSWWLFIENFINASTLVTALELRKLLSPRSGR